VACAGIGVIGLADLREAEWQGKLLLVTPYLAVVALTVWLGPHSPWAGVVAAGASAVMAGLSWCDTLDRQTEGFEWRFNNALSGAMCCGANWLVSMVTGCVALLITAAARDSMPISRSEQYRT